MNPILIAFICMMLCGGLFVVALAMAQAFKGATFFSYTVCLIVGFWMIGFAIYSAENFPRG